MAFHGAAEIVRCEAPDFWLVVLDPVINRSADHIAVDMCVAARVSDSGLLSGNT